MNGSAVESRLIESAGKTSQKIVRQVNAPSLIRNEFNYDFANVTRRELS